MILNLFKEIKTKIETDLTGIKVDLYNNQYHGGSITTIPLVLVKFEPLELSTLKGYLQESEANFSIHLISHSYSKSDKGINIDLLTTHEDLDTKLYKSLQKFSLEPVDNYKLFNALTELHE